MMILGDCITWGAGVRDWRDTWPKLVARELEHAESSYQLAVFASSGLDIQAHLDELNRSLDDVDPDVRIDQWYVSDIEVNAHRPHERRWGQAWSGHERLRSRSYLYFFLDKGRSATKRSERANRAGDRHARVLLRARRSRDRCHRVHRRNRGNLGDPGWVDAMNDDLLARAPLSTAPGAWHEVAVHMTTPERAHLVRLRVSGNGQTPFSVARVAFPVDYGMQVVDVTASLNTFNTHASIFNAHPNERAHRVIAEKVLESLRKRGAHH
jgi:hypothetical protein